MRTDFLISFSTPGSSGSTQPMVFANNLVITFMELLPKKSQMHQGLVPKQHGAIASHLKTSSRPNVLIITILRLQMFTMLHHFIYSTTSEIGCFLSQRSPKIFEPLQKHSYQFTISGAQEF